MVTSTFRRKVGEALRRSAPGWSFRVRERGVVVGTLGHINPCRVVAGAFRRENFKEVGRTVRVRHVIKLANEFVAAQMVDAALYVLDGALERFPKSSELLVARSAILPENRRDEAIKLLVKAVNGDLRSVSLERIALVTLERGSIRDIQPVRRAIHARLADGGAAHSDARAALLTLDAGAAYFSGAQVELRSGDLVVALDTLVLLAQWSRRDFRWEVLDAVVHELEQHNIDDGAVHRARKQIAPLVRVKGDVTKALALIDPLRVRAPDKGVMSFIAQCDDDLNLMERGWSASQRASRRLGEPGSIAYLLHSSLPYVSSGYATRTQGLLSGMARRGWQVDAVTRPRFPKDRPEGVGVPISELEKPWTLDGITYSRILAQGGSSTFSARVHHFANEVTKHERAEHWGVVHAASNHYVGLSAVEAARQLGVPSIYEVRGQWDITRQSHDPEYGGTERFVLATKLDAEACQLADHAFAITEGLRSFMIDRGVPADHISLLPNGVDVNRFTPSHPNEGLRKKLGLEGKTVVGYVGSVLDYEGLELLVDAVKILVENKQPVALLIVGDGKAFESVKSKVEQAGISDHVVLPGRVPHAEAEAYYSIIDIAPFPRLPLPVTELVSPLKPFEAMAMAKPVVVSSVGALTEIVTDGENGLVFTKGDVNSLAATLSRLVDSKEEREQLGAAGRDWVVANRSWDALSARIEEVYEKLGVPFPAK